MYFLSAKCLTLREVPGYPFVHFLSYLNAHYLSNSFSGGKHQSIKALMTILISNKATKLNVCLNYTFRQLYLHKAPFTDLIL